MKQNNRKIDSWGIEKDVQVPIIVYASEDDLSSDGKLILCSRKQVFPNDVTYINRQWIETQIQEQLKDKPDIMQAMLQLLNINN